MSWIPEASGIRAAIRLPPTNLLKPTEDLFALVLWCLNCVFYGCFLSLRARLTVLLGRLSHREGNTCLALNSAPDLRTRPGQPERLSFRTFSRADTLFLDVDSSKPFDFFFSFFVAFQ